MATRKAIEVGANSMPVKPTHAGNGNQASVKQLNRQNNISEKEFHNQIMHLNRERAGVERELEKIKHYRTEITAILGHNSNVAVTGSNELEDRTLPLLLERSVASLDRGVQFERIAEQDEDPDAGDAFHSIVKKMSITRNRPLGVRKESLGGRVEAAAVGRKLSNAFKRPPHDDGGNDVMKKMAMQMSQPLGGRRESQAAGTSRKNSLLMNQAAHGADAAKRQSMAPLSEEGATAAPLTLPEIEKKAPRQRRKSEGDMRDIQLKSIFREIGCKFTGQRAIEQRDVPEEASSDEGHNMRRRWRKSLRREKDLQLPLFSVLSDVPRRKPMFRLPAIA